MAGCPCMTAIFVALGLGGLYLLYRFIKDRQLKRKLEKWSNTPKDVVILHCFPAGKTIPNASPFVLKVQTFMRMANIKYEMDTIDFFGAKGKSPWISINGQHVADSEFIIEFLTKKFDVRLSKSHSEKQLATASSLRIMLDEHFIWGLALERVWDFHTSRKVTDFPRPLFLYVKWLVRRRSKAQGVGLHSKEDVERIMTKDLRIVSTILGNQKFICGDEPCEFDAGIWSQLAQCVWGLPGSRYETLLNGECSNLKDYAIRMKERYWKDWNQVVNKK